MRLAQVAAALVASAGAALAAPALPDADAKRLAAEAIAGDVVVDGYTQMYATEADARAHAADPAQPSAMVFALTVVKDRGDVVELTTKPADDDCEPAYRSSFVLDVFVPRARLLPRVDAGRVQTYPDGTAVAVDRGAAVQIAGGLAWNVEELAAPKLAPDPARLRYGITGPFTATALPALTAERLACDDEKPTSRAELENKLGERLPDYRVPWCALSRPSKAVIAGAEHAVPLVSRQVSNESVVADRGGYLADVAVHCGRLRYRLQDGVAYGMSGAGGVFETATIYTPSPGPVTWETGGKPAGTFTGDRRYRERSIKKVGDRICVGVDQIADRVCFPAKRVTVKKNASTVDVVE